MKPTAQFPGLHDLERIRTMLRVDLAGEIAANRIYQGQKLALKDDKATLEIIDEMHQQEKQHLSRIKDVFRRFNAQPTKLTPLAHGFAFILGYTSGLMGKDGAMICTEAVESVVSEHYNNQLRELYEIDPKEATKELRHLIRELRDEEMQHMEAAAESAVDQTVPSKLFRKTWAAFVRTGCRVAIKLAHKI